MSTEKPSIKARLVEETKSYLIIFTYLALMFGAFTIYRRLLLAEQGIAYLHYGFALIEALILAKVILIGRIFGLGNRFRDRAPIVSTLYKTLCFSVFVFAFCVLEHVVEGLAHHENFAAIRHHFLDVGIWEILARVIIMFTAFIPLFAFWEIGRLIGEESMAKLLFTRRPTPLHEPAEQARS